MALVLRDEQTLDIEQKLELRTIFKYKYTEYFAKNKLKIVFLLNWNRGQSRIIAFNLKSLKVLDKIVPSKEEAERLLIKTFKPGLMKKEMKDNMVPWVDGECEPSIMLLLIDMPIASETDQTEV